GAENVCSFEISRRQPLSPFCWPCQSGLRVRGQFGSGRIAWARGVLKESEHETPAPPENAGGEPRDNRHPRSDHVAAGPRTKKRAENQLQQTRHGPPPPRTGTAGRRALRRPPKVPAPPP
ncbi:unnamed protein product, partial [Amoebophrya sp. A120]